MFICSLPLESDDDNKDAAEVFESNILNSTVYIISIAFQVSTIAVNYRVNFEINQSIFISRFANNNKFFFKNFYSRAILLWKAFGKINH